MRALVQRVSEANVRVEGGQDASIGEGLVVFVGVGPKDGEPQVAKLWGKIERMRVFEDEAGRTNLSLRDVDGSVLIVSQFTLYADCKKGNRPSFTAAAAPGAARELYERFLSCAHESGIPVACGSFGAMMHVSLVNEGPFTIWLDTDAL